MQAATTFFKRSPNKTTSSRRKTPAKTTAENSERRNRFDRQISLRASRRAAWDGIVRTSKRTTRSGKRGAPWKARPKNVALRLGMRSPRRVKRARTKVVRRETGRGHAPVCRDVSFTARRHGATRGLLAGDDARPRSPTRQTANQATVAPSRWLAPNRSEFGEQACRSSPQQFIRTRHAASVKERKGLEVLVSERQRLTRPDETATLLVVVRSPRRERPKTTRAASRKRPPTATTQHR